MYQKLLTQVEEMGGLFKTKPITDEALVKTEEDLETLGLFLPDEYTEFLQVTDGMFWGGLEFFGSAIITDKKNGFSITDLYSQNRIYQALNPDVKKVFLGRSDEENFVFNPAANEYEIIDEFSAETIKTFPLFENLFSYILSEQIELIQNYVAFDEDEVKDEVTDEDF